MAAPPKLANVNDPILNRNFDAIEETLGDLLRLPFASVSYQRDVSLASGVNVVAHKLGVKPQGIILTSRSTTFDVRFDRTATTTNDRTMVLNAAGAVVCDVVVF
jgi:hypothetical protein